MIYETFLYDMLYTYDMLMNLNYEFIIINHKQKSLNFKNCLKVSS